MRQIHYKQIIAVAEPHMLIIEVICVRYSTFEHVHAACRWMIHLPVNDHETGEQHDQISAHSRLQCVGGRG